MEKTTQPRPANAQRRLAIAATLLALATAGCTEEALAFFGGHDVKPPAATNELLTALPTFAPSAHRKGTRVLPTPRSTPAYSSASYVNGVASMSGRR